MRRALLVVLALIVLAGCGGTARPEVGTRWPGGEVNVYAPTQGTIDAFVIAARRWNYSGAKVLIRVVRHERDADVIVRRDSERLREECGPRCFGFTTVFGRPDDGESEIVVREDLDSARPLGVWVAVHELGHVLGLRHRTDRGCSVMSPHWYDTRCVPSMAATTVTTIDPRCAPAPVDVDAAGKLYGGSASSRDPYCSEA